MIDVAQRDPTKTKAAMDTLITTAMNQGFAPVHFHIGFFNARDLLEKFWPRWRTDLDGGWPVTPIGRRTYRDIPFNICWLEDEIRLCANRVVGEPVTTFMWRPD